jgi:hypothetical protein
MDSTPDRVNDLKSLSADETDSLLVPPFYIGSAEYQAVSPLGAEVSMRTLDRQIADFNSKIDHPLNQGLILLKPHVNNSKVRNLVRTFLLESIDHNNDGGRILSDQNITSDFIDKGKLVDVHYRSFARYAIHTTGGSDIDPKEFGIFFHESLNKVRKEGRIFNCLEALSRLGLTPTTLGEIWNDAPENKIKKLSDGLFCGNLFINGANIYVVNGFYMAMRGSYLENNAGVYVFLIEWDPEVISWKTLRSKVTGLPLDSEISDTNSAQHKIFEQYERKYVDETPAFINNGIHMSASPLETLSERINWCSVTNHDVSHDKYGRMLLGRGIPEGVILDWCSNAKVKVPYSGDTVGYKHQFVFDAVRNMDTKECTDKLIEIYDYELFQTDQSRQSCGSGCACVMS